jgi:hypothetical protein
MTSEDFGFAILDFGFNHPNPELLGAMPPSKGLTA